MTTTLYRPSRQQTLEQLVKRGRPAPTTCLQSHQRWSLHQCTAGNPNPASDPFLLTQDQVPPTVTATIYQADGVTVISDGGTTGSRAAIFKIVASEHVLSVDTTSGAGLNGLVVGDLTGVGGCTNPKFWGWKDVYYLRCDWVNGAEVQIGIADVKVKDLAGNLMTPAVTAMDVTFT